MKFEITKEQILELSNLYKADSKVQLKEWFPEAFKPEIEVGKWYKNPGKCLYYVTQIESDGEYFAYGFNWLGKWCDETKFGNINDSVIKEVVEATQEEVKLALIAEAQRRGFEEGVKYLSAWNGYAECSYPNNLIFNMDSNCLASRIANNDCIFQNGKWAEIIEKPKRKMTVSQICEELGEEIEIVKD